jgi:DNA-binding transcriptional ArsR family regulator
VSGDEKPPRGLADLEAIDAVFTALDHPVRRHVLQVLAARDGEMGAGELHGRFQHSWPTTSRHLSVLLGAELVSVRSEGRERRYRLDRDRLADVLALWLRSVGLRVVPSAP